MDITHDTDRDHTILYEPLHDNPQLGNTHCNLHTVKETGQVRVFNVHIQSKLL